MPPSKPINIPRLNDHATAIGYLCFMYNGLEARVDKLLGILAGLNDSDLECFASQLDLLKKLPTLKALAFQKKPSQLWYDDIELMAWATGNYIIPKRNRFVHDIWLALPSGATRRHDRIRINRRQAYQERYLTTHEFIPTTADEIWDLVQDTRDVANILRHLHAGFESGRARTEPEASFPQRYRDKWRARQKPPRNLKRKCSFRRDLAVAVSGPRAASVLPDRDEPIAQHLAYVVGLGRLLLGRRYVGGEREVDELGRRAGDHRHAPAELRLRLLGGF
jgi:hypothetical protein